MCLSLFEARHPSPSAATAGAHFATSAIRTLDRCQDTGYPTRRANRSHSSRGRLCWSRAVLDEFVYDLFDLSDEAKAAVRAWG